MDCSGTDSCAPLVHFQSVAPRTHGLESPCHSNRSKIFRGTTHEVTLYVPKQYDPAKPACVYVNQDGVQWNAPVVFDNLIARKELPVLIGVFVRPGVVKSADPARALDRFNRSYEYDGQGDADGMRVDRDGRLYVATKLGIQICDQAGRVNAILSTPNRRVANVVFGGEKFDVLFATCGDKVFKRKLKTTGANAWDVPTKPPAPRL